MIYVSSFFYTCKLLLCVNLICFILYFYILLILLYFFSMASLELIDPTIDANHHSRLVGDALPPALRLRTHDECWRLDARWLPRYVVKLLFGLLFSPLIFKLLLFSKLFLLMTGCVQLVCYHFVALWSPRVEAVSALLWIVRCCQSWWVVGDQRHTRSSSPWVS